MRFWDSSAIVTMLAAQDGSGEMLKLLREDPGMVVWWGTRVECVVAINRLSREKSLDETQAGQARARLTFLSRNWLEVEPTENLREVGITLSFEVALKAADVLQLAAAIVWRGEDAPGLEFVCLDVRLRDAAISREFAPLPQVETA